MVPNVASHSQIPGVGMQRIIKNSKGFTLIEMMIAIFILSFSILALLNLTITSIQANMQNDIRNTAVRLTNQVSEILLAVPIDAVVPGGLTPYDNTNAVLKDPLGLNVDYFKQYPDPVQTMRGGTQLYAVTWTVSTLSNDLRQIEITVQYTYRNQTYTNRAVVYKHRAV